MTYKDKYLQWLSFADEDTKSELKSITDDKEIEDRFYKDLAFGTGGLRVKSWLSNLNWMTAIALCI